jgi:hypothetical protein
MSDNLRELDARFAREVLRCKVRAPVYASYGYECGCGSGVHADEESSRSALLPFTDSIGAAWLGVEEIQRKHCWRFCLLGGDKHMPYFQAEFFGHEDPRKNYGQRHAHELADHPAEAIVRACLAAVEAQRK